MTSTTHIIRFGVVLSMVFVSAQALAWGPRAQRAITGMGIQVIQTKYPGTFRPGDTNYESDVLRGAEAGTAVISKSLPINTEEEAIQAVGIQIQLLRDVRPEGAGSYFAYRMGALSALISDVLLPYGLAWTPEDKALLAKMDKDINTHLSDFGYTDPTPKRSTITDVEYYFRSLQVFYGDNRLLIKEDYRRGPGYDGFLKESGQTFFSKSVEATSDAWFTIIQPKASGSKAPVTSALMQDYFVNEIAYLLEQKANIHQADFAYDNLAELSPTDPEVFEQVGDNYYAFGTPESTERSVSEWRTAYSLSGPNRDRVADKLSKHYLNEGRSFLEEAEEKGKGETELPSALSSFQEALRFDRTSEVAADLIQETNRRKKARDERREMIVKIIASAASTQEQAENQATGGNFGNSISSYRKALEILAAVDDEFTDQFEISKDMEQGITRSVSTTISDVQDLASSAIAEGERQEESHKYEDAIKSYERVAAIVEVIPDDHTKNSLEAKLDIIELADAKIEQAKKKKIQYDEASKNPQGRPKPPAN